MEDASRRTFKFLKEQSQKKHIITLKFFEHYHCLALVLLSISIAQHLQCLELVFQKIPDIPKIILFSSFFSKPKFTINISWEYRRSWEICLSQILLSADSHSSALLVRPSQDQEEEGLFSNSLEYIEELKVWGCQSITDGQPVLSWCLAVA